MKLVVLRAGEPAAPVAARYGSFVDWIQREMSPVWDGAWEEIDVRAEDAPLTTRDVSGFVLTGSSSNVTERAPWMLRLESFLRDVVGSEVPLFGICFGHQIVAKALGGDVGKNPRGREIGTVLVRRVPLSHSLFANAPESFLANTTHMESVVRLPPGAQVLASSDLEPTQAFVVGKSVACVQFHPEFDGAAMRAYVEARSNLIEAEGRDPAPIVSAATDTPVAAETLRNFVRHYVKAR